MAAPMRRLLLLLLAFVLPLQLSWAATQLCDGEDFGARSVAAAQLAEHAHGEASGEAGGSTSGKHADACCDAAHGCNGLHHPIGQADPQVPSLASTHWPAQCSATPPLSGPPGRIERPNWLAA